jgi:hypothetical protein
VIERGKLGITEQPSDLLERHTLIFEITKSEAVPQAVEDLAEGGVLLSETPRK